MAKLVKNETSTDKVGHYLKEHADRYFENSFTADDIRQKIGDSPSEVTAALFMLYRDGFVHRERIQPHNRKPNEKHAQFRYWVAIEILDWAPKNYNKPKKGKINRLTGESRGGMSQERREILSKITYLKSELDALHEMILNCK